MTLKDYVMLEDTCLIGILYTTVGTGQGFFKYFGEEDLNYVANLVKNCSDILGYNFYKVYKTSDENYTNYPFSPIALAPKRKTNEIPQP